MTPPFDLYNPAYGNFVAAVSKQIRREAYDEDIGQNSWLTADEFREFLNMLALMPASNVLEIGSGSGGPSLFVARTIGCQITGIEISENGIANANRMAIAENLNGCARFLHADASKQLPFNGKAFDAIFCIDSINHLPGRAEIFREWFRILKPGGRVLFTDPIIITGIVSNDEINIRSSMGSYFFVPPGENERLLKDAGFELLLSKDVTGNEANVSKRRYDARRNHKDDLLKIEDQNTFETQQRFLDIVHCLSSEKRLSRIVFLVQAPFKL